MPPTDWFSTSRSHQVPCRRVTNEVPPARMGAFSVPVLRHAEVSSDASLRLWEQQVNGPVTPEAQTAGLAHLARIAEEQATAAGAQLIPRVPAIPVSAVTIEDWRHHVPERRDRHLGGSRGGHDRPDSGDKAVLAPAQVTGAALARGYEIPRAWYRRRLVPGAIAVAVIASGAGLYRHVLFLESFAHYRLLISFARNDRRCSSVLTAL